MKLTKSNSQNQDLSNFNNLLMLSLNMRMKSLEKQKIKYIYNNYNYLTIYLKCIEPFFLIKCYLLATVEK